MSILAAPVSVFSVHTVAWPSLAAARPSRHAPGTGLPRRGHLDQRDDPAVLGFGEPGAPAGHRAR